MMLLSLCLEEGLDVVVCFVNYKIRESADLEERLVERFCSEHGVMVLRYSLRRIPSWHEDLKTSVKVP